MERGWTRPRPRSPLLRDQVLQHLLGSTPAVPVQLTVVDDVGGVLVPARGLLAEEVVEVLEQIRSLGSPGPFVECHLGEQRTRFGELRSGGSPIAANTPTASSAAGRSSRSSLSQLATSLTSSRAASA